MVTEKELDAILEASSEWKAKMQAEKDCDAAEDALNNAVEALAATPEWKARLVASNTCYEVSFALNGGRKLSEDAPEVKALREAEKALEATVEWKTKETANRAVETAVVKSKCAAAAAYGSYEWNALSYFHFKYGYDAEDDECPGSYEGAVTLAFVPVDGEFVECSVKGSE